MRPKTRGEPLTDQSQKTLIPDAVGEKTSHSPPISSVEEFAEIRIDDAVDPTLLNADCDRMQCIVLTTPRTKAVREVLRFP